MCGLAVSCRAADLLVCFANRLQVVLDGVDSVRKLDSCSMALVPWMQECPSWLAADNAAMLEGEQLRKPRNIHVPTEIFPIIIRALYDGGSLLQAQLEQHRRTMLVLAYLCLDTEA